MAAQSTSPLTVEVSAVTGVSTQGLVVELYGEDSGWVFDPVKVKADGTAKFSYVPDGVFTLTVDGSPLGLEFYKNDNLVHSGTQNFQVVLSEAVRTPYALSASLSHDDFTGADSATLSWNRETDYFFDDFESYEPFATEFAPWTGHDLDREPAAEIQGGYPNRGTQQYATIFNALTIDPPVYYEYEVLRPYSGKQYVGFVRTRSGNANNDWLISPKIKVGVRNIVSFMAKASERQPDRFAVCISTTGTEVKDFIQLTPGNYQTVDYKEWYEISYDLSKYEGQEVYIAIHCMSQNSFMFMVDDFYVGPQSVSKKARRVSRRSADNPNESFVITLDGNRVGETEDYSFTVDGLTSGRHTLGVTAQYLQSSSEESKVEIEVPSADSYASLTLRLTSELETSLEGIAVSLLNTADARRTLAVADASGKAVVGSLPKGDYMLNIESDLFDVFNLSFSLQEDKVIEIPLSERVTAPYNIIYQTSANDDGSYDVAFSWNRDLGFRESFEDYEDFTQQIGEWTVLDIDRMPTYAFSVGDALITKPAMREEVGAMVFNPFTTEPVQAALDALFLAPDGIKYAMFNSAEAARSDDWLISPTLRIGRDYVLRFSAKSYSYIYPGLFEFCALKDKNIASPDILDSFYLDEDWLRYEVDLAAYEGESIEIAFHHTTYDGWLSFIDDVYVGPGEESDGKDESTALCSYDVSLDGSFVANVSEPEFTFRSLAVGTHVAGIGAVYPSGRRSEVSELSFTIGENGMMEVVADPADAVARYYDLNGMEVEGTRLSPGVYIRVSGSRASKVVVR